MTAFFRVASGSLATWSRLAITVGTQLVLVPVFVLVRRYIRRMARTADLLRTQYDYRIGASYISGKRILPNR
jgi:hypothetical protein